MSEELPLFSTEWCAAAVRAAADSVDLRPGMADPESFDIVLAFSCTDAEPACWARFRSGRVEQWEPGPPPTGPGVARLSAPIKTWCAAADHDEVATNLLLGRKIKLRDTHNTVTSNYQALDALLASWYDIDTDWTA
ncbi:MAG: hypothetical protein ACT4QG_10400 [Sporichthyaceae bacterium]